MPKQVPYICACLVLIKGTYTLGAGEEPAAAVANYCDISDNDLAGFNMLVADANEVVISQLNLVTGPAT